MPREPKRKFIHCSFQAPEGDRVLGWDLPEPLPEHCSIRFIHDADLEPKQDCAAYPGHASIYRLDRRDGKTAHYVFHCVVREVYC